MLVEPRTLAPAPAKKSTSTVFGARALKSSLIIGALLATDLVLADGGTTVGSVATNITSTLTSVASLIGGIAYVAGIAFILAGMVKFKAHKDNPQQAPLSAAFVLLAVGAGLVFLPSLISTAGGTLFGGSGEKGSATGSDGAK